MIFASIASLALALPQDGSREERYWRIETARIPEGVELEVGGLLQLADGRVMACTRRGEAWTIENAFGDAPKYVRFAQGLHEPLGLAERDGWIHVIQRGELSRLKDSDGDGRADTFETICDAWPISGNYHEYNFGPAIDREGNFWITTNKPFGDEPFGRAKWRGFALRIAPDGTMKPMACGLRSPAGVGFSPLGDLFYTDNQGEWCGASKLAHIEPGDFHGHPWGTFACEDELWTFTRPGAPPNGEKMPDVQGVMPSFKLPAVWFPYDKMGRSPAGFVWQEIDGRFGPFAGQLFVGDQYQSSVMRVALEQVGGRWQGACFPFRLGFQCGIIRLAWDRDGALLCGETDRGWGSLGGQTMGLQRLVWTGEVPFEIRSMHATPTGFRLEFTRPAERGKAADPASYAMTSYTYLLHDTYGSPETDTATCEVTSVQVADDGLSAVLAIEPLREGYVHELRASLVAEDGEAILHDKAYYTLVRIPR